MLYTYWPASRRSSATLIREPPSVSCCRQNQHLQKSEAYKSRIYNFSAERSQYLVRRSKMGNYKYSTWYPKHVPRHSREDFVPRKVLEASKTCRSYRVLCSISLLLQTEPLALGDILVGSCVPSYLKAGCFRSWIGCVRRLINEKTT